MRKSDIKRWDDAITLIEKAKVKLELIADNVFMQDTEYIVDRLSVDTFLKNEIRDIGAEIQLLKNSLKMIKENQHE